MPKAKAAAMKALEIDGQLGAAYLPLGYVAYSYDFDWAAAKTDFDKALELNKHIRERAHFLSALSQLASAGHRKRSTLHAVRWRPIRVSAAFSHNVAVQMYLARADTMTRSNKAAKLCESCRTAFKRTRSWRNLMRPNPCSKKLST